MKTTAKQFAEFKAECERLQALWGLNDWDIRLLHENPKSSGALASCTSWGNKRVATIRLSHTAERSAPSFKALARHEMVHVLVGSVCDMATDRWGDANAFEQAEEALVQRLLRLLP